MPFTPAHVAAVLPVIGREQRWVVPAAWVVGSMAPDLVYFTPVPWVRPLSHSLVGLLTLDLALGVVVLAAWWWLVGPAARDLLPRACRVRVASPLPPSGRWPWVLAGLLLGSVTHVVWDAFTHHDGWAVSRVPALREPLLGGQPAYSVLQDASGAVGLLVVVAFVGMRLHGAAAVHDGAPVLSRRERGGAWAALVLGPVALCTTLTAAAASQQAHLVNALFVGFTRTVGLCAVAAVLASLGWHVLRLRRPATVGHG